MTYDTSGSIWIMTGIKICDPGFQVLAGGDQQGQPDSKNLHRIQPQDQ